MDNRYDACALLGVAVLTQYNSMLRMLKDDRVKTVHARTLFSQMDDDDFVDKLG